MGERLANQVGTDFNELRLKWGETVPLSEDVKPSKLQVIESPEQLKRDKFRN